MAPVLLRMLEEEGMSPGGALPLEREAIEARALPESPEHLVVTPPGLAPDAIANDRSLPPLTCSGGRPFAQEEASVAVLGNDVLVSFNDIRTPRQNYAYSTDGGATFTDGNGFPIASDGSNVNGDPTVAVNRKTGEFYVAGLSNTHGTVCKRGHFSGSSFVWDDGRLVAPANTPDFYDKPWMTVDSLSGNVYVSWTNFNSRIASFIGFVRCDADLNPLSPQIAVNDTTIGNGTQFSQIAVGPSGEVYIAWRQYSLPDHVVNDDPVQIQIRRSNDFGATFGPKFNVNAVAPDNEQCGGPGYLRSFVATQPSLAVDCSHGPHRGRAYVAWDAPFNIYSVAMPFTTTRFESEPNNTSATANLLVPGGKLRGTKSGAEEDWFQIDLNAGDTFYTGDQNMYPAFDSTSSEISVQIYSPDLSGNLHLAANGIGPTGVFYSAPRTASYFLRLFSTTPSISKYVLLTQRIPAGTFAGPARDARDQLVSWSDGGTIWRAPVRVNDSAPGFDSQYPSLTVDDRGRVFCGFMDWRDDLESGTASTEYVAMSGDGGVTWGPNVRAGDAVSGWSGAACLSNSNNQGDYQMMASQGDRIALAFTDARLGDPDVFVDCSVFSQTPSGPALVVASRDTTFAMKIRNGGNFTRGFAWSLGDGSGWLTGTTSGSPTLAAGDSATILVSVHPKGFSGDSSVVRLALADPLIPGYADTAKTVVRLSQSVSVPPAGPVAALTFPPPAPSPSHGPMTMQFGLPRAGRAELAVFDVTGARVRTLLDADAAAGTHALGWDGCDGHGHPVPAGVYLVRLKTGRESLSRRVVVAP